MAILISQSIPPFYLLGIHTFLWLYLYFCFANKFICTIFLEYTFMCKYTFVFLFLTYFILYDSL